MIDRPIDRRTLLAGAGGVTLLGVAAGCSTGSAPEENSASANTAVELPTYIEYEGVKPDLPGTEEGVDPAFHHFPAKQAVSVEEKPGSGETLSGLGNLYVAVPPERGQELVLAGLERTPRRQSRVPDGRQRRLGAEVRHGDRRE